MGLQIEESAAASASVVAPSSTETSLEDPGLVEFAAAGDVLAGEFRCADCGYGAVIQRVLPRCPMCGGTVWESLDSQRPHVAG